MAGTVTSISTAFVMNWALVYWNPNPQQDGIRRLGFCGAIRSWGWSPHEWDSCPCRKRQKACSSLCFLPSEDTKRKQPSATRKDFLTRYQICEDLHLGLSSLQNWILVVLAIQSVTLLQQLKLRRHSWAKSKPSYHTIMCVCVYTCTPTHSVSSIVPNSLRLHGLYPTTFLCPWDSPQKNTRVGCHTLLQGIFPTQRWNLHLLHCKQILYH